MIVKIPASYDLSSYVSVPDWGAISPRPIFVYTRATVGLTPDIKFGEFMQAMLSQGIARGAYCYFYPTFTATGQAQKFISVVTPYLNDDDVIILDVEEAGISGAMMKSWFVAVRQAFPKNIVMIYSRANILNPISLTDAEKFYLKQIPIITAGYPNNPDLFNDVPVAYIPDQTKWGRVLAWQYGKSDFITGINGETDLNFLRPEFMQLLGLSGDTQPPADVTTTLFPGVQQITGTRNGWKFWLHIIDKTKVRYEVVNVNGIAPVSYFVNRRGAQIGWNGSDYDRTTYELHHGSPSFYQSGDVQNNTGGDVYALRPLIVNGEIVDMSSNEPKWTEGHARCIFGETTDGRMMHWISEGVYPNQGLRFRECATVLQSYGAFLAGDAGGGGDATLSINGETTNLTENIDPESGEHFERPIPQILLAYIQQEGSPMNGTAKEKLGNTSTVRLEPSRYGTDSGGRIAAGSTIEFVEIVPVVIKGIADNREDKWFKLPDGKFVNYILASREYYTVLTMPTVTPPPTPEPTGVPFTLNVEGYKPFSGTLEKA